MWQCFLPCQLWVTGSFPCTWDIPLRSIFLQLWEERTHKPCFRFTAFKIVGNRLCGTDQGNPHTISLSRFHTFLSFLALAQSWRSSSLPRAQSPPASYFNVLLLALQPLPITSQREETSSCSLPQSSTAMLSMQSTTYCLASQIPQQLWATSRQENRFVTFSHFGNYCLDKEENSKVKNGPVIILWAEDAKIAARTLPGSAQH